MNEYGIVNGEMWEDKNNMYLPGMTTRYYCNLIVESYEIRNTY